MNVVSTGASSGGSGPAGCRCSATPFAPRSGLITSELAIDLARFPGLNTWSGEDLNILASLFVNSMIVIAEAIEDAHDQAALRRDQASRGQAAPDDRRRCRRLAQHRLTQSGTGLTCRRMPNLELTYPRPDIAVLTLNRPEKLNALSYRTGRGPARRSRRDPREQRLPGRRAHRRGPRILLGTGPDRSQPGERGRRNGVPAVRNALAGKDRRTHREDPSPPAAGDRGGQRCGLRRRNGHRAGLRYPHRVRIRAVLHAVHQARPRRLRHRRQLHAAPHRRRGPGVRPHPDRTRGGRRRGAAARVGLPRFPPTARWSTTRWRSPKHYAAMESSAWSRPSRCCGRTSTRRAWSRRCIWRIAARSWRRPAG